MSLNLVAPQNQNDPELQKRTELCTLTLLIPRYYNPDPTGTRRKIEWRKLRATIAELRLLFPGYTAMAAKGWNREDNVLDRHLQLEIDFVPSTPLRDSLVAWKGMLQRRFQQRSMYMKVTPGGMWL